MIWAITVANFLEPNPQVWFNVLEDRKPGNSIERLDIYELYSTVDRASFRHIQEKEIHEYNDFSKQLLDDNMLIILSGIKIKNSYIMLLN